LPLERRGSAPAPVPLLNTLLFRGLDLQEAWSAARLRETVLLDLQEDSPEYLEDVRRFLATRRDRKLIIQTPDANSLRPAAHAAVGAACGRSSNRRTSTICAATTTGLRRSTASAYATVCSPRPSMRGCDRAD
jgi:hypothetical protein